ncbi:MAG: hypothetical protein GY861_26040 [bacterium]|nr:hypothetical protein [bacterium]
MKKLTLLLGIILSSIFAYSQDGGTIDLDKFRLVKEINDSTLSAQRKCFNITDGTDTIQICANDTFLVPSTIPDYCFDSLQTPYLKGCSPLSIHGDTINFIDGTDTIVFIRSGEAEIDGALDVNGLAVFDSLTTFNDGVLFNDTATFESKVYIQDSIEIHDGTDSTVITPRYFYQMDGGDITTLRLGKNAGLVDDGSANNNTFVGSNAGKANTSGIYNICLGSLSGANITTGNHNTLIGYAIGGATATAISNNVCIGHDSYRKGELNDNVTIGYQCGEQVDFGEKNVYIGSEAVFAPTNDDGDQNVCIGYQSGYSGPELGNIFIGYQSGYNEVGNNKLYIENSNSATPLIYGEFDNKFLSFNNGQCSNSSDTVASAATITLGYYNNFVVSGTADIDSINTASNIPEWTLIYIEFTGNAAANGIVDGKNIKLSGNFAYTTDDTMILQRRGDYFIEFGRTAN